MKPKAIETHTIEGVLKEAQKPRKPLTEEQIKERDAILAQLSGIVVVGVKKDD